jgi:hypothetical protein
MHALTVTPMSASVNLGPAEAGHEDIAQRPMHSWFVLSRVNPAQAPLSGRAVTEVFPHTYRARVGALIPE